MDVALEDPDRYDPIRTLRDHAGFLDAISRPAWWPEVYYESMSGALIWSDEFIRDGNISLTWALRPVFAFRTSLLLGRPREAIRLSWDLGLALFPSWIGFRPERRRPTPRLLRIHQRGEDRLDRELREGVFES